MKIRSYKINKFTLDIGMRELFYGDESIPLSSRAFDILHYLIEKKGTIVTKDSILERVWKDSFVEEANLTVHMSAIRRVLKEKKGENKYIKTISGQGYSFVYPVEEISSNLVGNEKKLAPTSLMVEETTTSLAVLPMVFERETNKNEYLANGITQSIINDLSQVLDLKVISFNAVKVYKHSKLELQEIGFLLDADKLFIGTINEYENQLSISVELINAKDKRCLWGREYTFKADDIFKVKKEISKVIAQKLKLKLIKEKTPEIISEAQKLYYRGKFILESRTTKKLPKDYLLSALDFFKKAVEIEPDYPLAHIGIGTVNVSLHNLNIGGKETFVEAKTALQKALDSGEKLSEAYVLEGSIKVMFEDDLSGARNSFDKAIKLNQNNADAYHWKGLACMLLGEYDEAYKLENTASSLDPTSIRFNEGLMRIFFYSSNFEKAIVQSEELLEFDGNNPSCYLMQALSYAHLGSLELALKNIDIAIKLRESSNLLLIKAYIYALFSKKTEALKIVKDVLANFSSPALDHRDIALVYTALNENELAVKYLRKAKTNNKDLEYIKYDIRFKNLWDFEEFKVLIIK